jgi:hypothetical protein
VNTEPTCRTFLDFFSDLGHQRTTDLDEVGDDTHLTVFGMLGSWSRGDYDGPQSLRWGYELLTDGLGLDHSRLHVTAFGGDQQVEPDRDSQQVWGELGVPVELTTNGNWWSNGPTGPCGPDSEIFVWAGQESPTGTPSTDRRWVEVWNHVMLCYHRHQDGTLRPLRQHNPFPTAPPSPRVVPTPGAAQPGGLPVPARHPRAAPRTGQHPPRGGVTCPSDPRTI